MMTDYPIESILAVDCGNVFTKAVLIDVVEGQYRLVAYGKALTTVKPPHPSLALGVARAIAEIESTVGRKLSDDDATVITPEREDGAGVDAMVVTTSIGKPLRLFLAGFADDEDIDAVHRAVSGTKSIVVDSLLLKNRIQAVQDVEDVLMRLERSEVDAILLVGPRHGSTGIPMADLARILAMSCQVSYREDKPAIIYVGDFSSAAGVTGALADLPEMELVEDVSASPEDEDATSLTQELINVYTRRRLGRLPGMSELSAHSQVSVLPTSQAYGYTLAYLSARYGLNVAGLDLGAKQTTVGWAMQGRSELLTQDDWGVTAAEPVLAEVGLDHLLRWLPEPIDPAEAMRIILNLSLYPGVIPGSVRELQLVQALGRESLARILEQARGYWSTGRIPADPQWDLILLSGDTFAQAPHAGQAALMALDTLQPAGIGTLALDSPAMASSLGAIATFQPHAAAQVLEQDGFVSLGTVVAPVGSAKPGSPAVEVKVTYPDQRTLEVEVPSGSLEVIPLATGQKATLDLQLNRKFQLNWSKKSRHVTAEVDGGVLGIVVDARGRPLPALEDVNASQGLSKQWLMDIGA